MNTTLQCMKVFPELRDALTRHDTPATPAEMLAGVRGTPQALTRGERVNVTSSDRVNVTRSDGVI